MNACEHLSLLELPLVLLHLHVHLGKSLLVQLPFAYLLDRIRAQILELHRGHARLPRSELLFILLGPLLAH